MTQNTNGYKIGTEKRLAILETSHISLVEKIDEIKDNHLPHLDAKVDRIQWLIVTTLITLVVLLITNLINGI